MTTIANDRFPRARLAALTLAVLPFAACGGEPATSPASKPAPAETASTPAPAAETPAAATTDTQTALRDEPGKPGELDTGVDLSALKESESPSAARHAFGPDGQTPVMAPPGSVTADVAIDMLDEQTRSFHFGDVLQGERATHVFAMQVSGQDDLVISRIKPSCGCTVADPFVVDAEGTKSVYTIGEPLKPGTRFEIEASLKTEGRSGEMSSNIAIYSNVPEGVQNLNLRANVTPMLVVEPDTVLNFDRITTAQSIEGSLKIRSTILDPYMLTLDSQFMNEELARQIKLELVPIDPTPEGKAKEWEAKVTLGPGLPEGMRNYPLLFHTDFPIPNPKVPVREGEPQPTYEVRAFVQATVTGLVSATPNFISFGMVRPGQPVERYVYIRAHDDYQLPADMPVRVQGLKGEEFPYPDAVTWSLEPAQEEGNVKLTVRVEGLPEDLNGSFGGAVLVGVGHPDKPEVEIKFSGVCRQGVPTRPSDALTQPGTGSHDGHDH